MPNNNKLLKALQVLNTEFPNSDEQSMIASLGNAENWGKDFHVGRTWQKGRHILVVAIDPNSGKRCVKVMAEAPEDIVLTESGLQEVLKAWLNGNIITATRRQSMLSGDRIRAIALAAALDGDATSG